MGAHGRKAMAYDKNCSKKQSMGDQAAVTANPITIRPRGSQDLATKHGVSGGCEQLGPQMILRRDLQRGIQGMSRKVGVKSRVLRIVQGVKKPGIKLERSWGSGSLIETSEQSVGLAMGASNKNLREVGKTKLEWVVVGFKRKKEEKPKVYRKENRLGGRSKSKYKELVKSGAYLVEVTNAFSFLQDLAPNSDNLMHGAMHANVNMGSTSMLNKHSKNDPVHGSRNAERVGSDVVVDVDMRLGGKKFERADMENILGSGLAPTISTQS